MSDLAILVAMAKATLQEVSKQAAGLGTGLQNAAPGDKTNAPNNSVEYLLAISDALEKSSRKCEENFLASLPRDSQSNSKP